MLTVTQENQIAACVSKTNALPYSKSDRELRRRAEETLSVEAGFIMNSNFHDGEEALRDEDAIFVLAIENGSSSRPLIENVSGLPGHLACLCETPLLRAEQERTLFRRMNFLKYRANVLRASWDENWPDESILDDIGSLLKKAERIRNHLIQANLRLVISVVKRLANKRNPFDEMLSEGITTVVRAVEKFDYSRGFRFSTYATRSIRFELFRVIENRQKQSRRFLTNADDTFDASQKTLETSDAGTLDTAHLHGILAEMLQQLDSREEYIVRMRFGLADKNSKTTFAEIGNLLGISKERVRQLYERSIGKLQALTVKYGIESTEIKE